MLLVREIEFLCLDITKVMLTKINYQNLIIKNQNAGHRKLRQNKKKGRALPNSNKNTKWLSKELKISQENVQI